jgi:yecA family protein
MKKRKASSTSRGSKSANGRTRRRSQGEGARHTPPATATPAYRHGFFTAVISGPMMVPTEWLMSFTGANSYASIEDLDAAMNDVLKVYNEVASQLLERPDDFIEGVVSVCAEGDAGEALVDWYHGFISGVALRSAEWKTLIDAPSTGDLFTPFAAMQDILSTPRKREWLRDRELRRNLSRSFGILGVRVWNLWREQHPSATEEV